MVEKGQELVKKDLIGMIEGSNPRIYAKRHRSS